MKTKNKDYPSPVDSFSVEQINLDFVKSVAHRLNATTAFGRYSKSNVVNYALTLIRKSDKLKDKLDKLIVSTEMKHTAKMVKKYGPSYLGRMRRSVQFNKEIMRRVNETKPLSAAAVKRTGKLDK